MTQFVHGARSRHTQRMGHTALSRSDNDGRTVGQGVTAIVKIVERRLPPVDLSGLAGLCGLRPCACHGVDVLFCEVRGLLRLIELPQSPQNHTR